MFMGSRRGKGSKEPKDASQPGRGLSAPTVPGRALLEALQGLGGRCPGNTQSEGKLAPPVLKKFQGNRDPE